MANPTITFNTTLNQAGALKDARTLRNNLGKPIDIKLNTRSLAQPLGRITGDVAEFTKSLQAATARVTAFGATSGGIIAVSQAISMVAKSVIEVDKQLIELNTFLGQSQSGLKSIGDSLFKVAKKSKITYWLFSNIYEMPSNDKIIKDDEVILVPKDITYKYQGKIL